MPKLTRGILCALEGIDGSGKTVLAANLYKALVAQEFPVLLTKEPGATSLGKHLREILQKQAMPISAKAEYLLFAANRAQHFEEIIIPALQKNNLVISDRLGDSSLVYQGYGRGLNLDMIRTINNWAMNDTQPDFILYIKIDANTAQKRLMQRGNMAALDKRSIDSFATLITGFDTIFATRTNVIVLDGTLSPETLLNQALTNMMPWLPT